MKKLISMMMFMALCFCMVPRVVAQSGYTSIGQTSALVSHSLYDTTAQSFTLDESSYVQMFRLVVFSRYHTTDHPGTLTVVKGDGPRGDTVMFELPILVKSLNKFFPESMLDTISLVEMEILWQYDIQSQIDSGDMGFEDLETDFPVGEMLPAGQYTVVVALDTTVTNSFGYRSVMSFTNCYDYPCAPPFNTNPYVGGSHYFGNQLFTDPDRDMAFQVRILVENISTNVFEQVEERLALPSIYDGVMTAPASWSGQTLHLYDATGRELYNKLILGGEMITIPTILLVVVSLESKTSRLTTKLILGS